MKVLSVMACVLAASMLVVATGCQKKPEENVDPLETAVKEGDQDKLDDLFDTMPDEAAKKDLANIALRYAALHNKVDLLPKLIEKGADIKKANSDGQTPLHIAALNGNMEMVKALVEKGVDINAKTLVGSTPMDDAAGAEKKDVAEYLKQRGGRSGF